MLRNLLAASALIVLSTPVFAEGDGPGPNLVIEVAGTANGEVVIDLSPDLAPKAVAQIVALAKAGAYDNVVFHRVIDGFMAQTGDVKYGKKGGDTSMAGMGGSDMADLPAEFSEVPYARGIVGMARSPDPNSANSQFFIMFSDGPKDSSGNVQPWDNLNGQYTVVGKVIKGMEIVDAIKRGDGANGEVADPDVMAKVTVQE